MRVASHISTNTGTFDGALWPLRCQSYRSPLLLCRGYRLDKKCMQQIATNSKQKNRLDTCELSRCHCLPQPTLQLSRRTNHAFRRIDQGQVSFPCAMPCQSAGAQSVGRNIVSPFMASPAVAGSQATLSPTHQRAQLDYQQRKTKRGRGWKGELVGCHVPTN